MFAGRLLSRSKAARQLRRLEHEQETLRFRREELEQQLANLGEKTQTKKPKKMKAKGKSLVLSKKGDEGSVIWGPADPDLVNVKPYRRYWMERPPRAPKLPPRRARSAEPGGKKSSLTTKNLADLKGPRSASADGRGRRAGGGPQREGKWSAWTDLFGGEEIMLKKSSALEALALEDANLKEKIAKGTPEDALDDDAALDRAIQLAKEWEARREFDTWCSV